MNEDEIEERLEEANDRFNQRDPHQCILLCKEILVSDPNNTFASLFAAASYQIIGQHKKAVNLF